MHAEKTSKGNSKRGKSDFNKFYKIVTTPKYVCIKCNVHRKCRFAVWYGMKLSGSDPTNIKYCRTINNNHDIEWHKEENCF